MSRFFWIMLNARNRSVNFITSVANASNRCEKSYARWLIGNVFYFDIWGFLVYFKLKPITNFAVWMFLAVCKRTKYVPAGNLEISNDTGEFRRVSKVWIATRFPSMSKMEISSVSRVFWNPTGKETISLVFETRAFSREPSLRSEAIFVTAEIALGIKCAAKAWRPLFLIT